MYNIALNMNGECPRSLRPTTFDLKVIENAQGEITHITNQPIASVEMYRMTGKGRRPFRKRF